ncbi:hypothetical protein C8R47DRAFT_262582 [Mycena vitilis]|nr:hypothetical protein C8R47DRAFT_262582 [Mycena vitilis]
MSLATAVLGIGIAWILLIASKKSCADDVITFTFISSLLKIFFLMIAIPFIFFAQDSGFRSVCVNTGLTLWCTPFIMFKIGPIVEITTLLFAASTVRRRAIIKYGCDEVPAPPLPPPPPQPPVYRPAWETAPVAELNHPLSLEKLESHVSGLSVRTIYWLAFALLIIAGLCSGVAARLKPFPHDDDDDIAGAGTDGNDDGDGDKSAKGMTYLEFCRLSFFYLAVPGCWWLSLICMSRQKASKDERAGDHVGYALYNGLVFLFICFKKRSETCPLEPSSSFHSWIVSSLCSFLRGRDRLQTRGFHVRNR